MKGLVHPEDRVIAYVRYIPDLEGDRVRDGRRYRKLYKLRDRRELLRRDAPLYLYVDPVFGMEMQGAPLNSIARIYLPRLKLRKLLRSETENIDQVERQALEFAQLLSARSGVPTDCIGVSGSILVGLHGQSSDIDLVVYGKRNGLRVYESLKDLMESGHRVKSYGYEELLNL